MYVRVQQGGFMITYCYVRILVPMSYWKLWKYIYIYIYMYISSVRQSCSSRRRRSRSLSVLPFRCPSRRRRPSSVRPSRRPSRRRRPSSVRPSRRVPSCPVVAVVVPCSSVRPVVPLNITYKTSRGMRRMGTELWHPPGSDTIH